MKIYHDLSDRLLKVTGLREKRQSIPVIDQQAIAQTIQRALSSAGLDVQAGPMKGVTDTIQKALSAAGLNGLSAANNQNGVTLEGSAHRVDTPGDGSQAPFKPIDLVRPGEFQSRSFSNAAGTRAYKLYVPSSYSSEMVEAVPLLVMLHGCTQSPDDFAAGTRMNALAEEHGFLVVYPAQATHANCSKCWNWFRTEDQSRDQGEPSMIAGITREVASNYRIDERRIFVAGLSAGAAMAVVLGITYPELFAAVGAHSGLPYGAARDMPSAFSAMQGGVSLDAQNVDHSIPTIVFHGDCDYTVDVSNCAAIVQIATAGRSNQPRLRRTETQGLVSGGRTYTRTVYTDAANQPVVEQWVLHGAGHAWSGGSSSGSFTDTFGPDASAEMIRFFYSQLRAGTA